MNRTTYIGAGVCFGAGVILTVLLGFVAYRLAPAPSLEVPAEVSIVPPALTARITPKSSGPVKWHVVTPGIDLIEMSDGSVIVIGATKGRYQLLCYTARAGKPSPLLPVSVTVGEPGPVPPGPDPVPPIPPGPVPTEGNRVLIVYEKQGPLTPGQFAAIYSKTMWDYLDAHCCQEKGKKGWNIWDDQADTANVAKVWQDAFSRPRKSIPWLWINGPKAVYEGPLPATIGETMILLKKYLGE